MPGFLPLETSDHQGRLTASTHNKAGILQNKTPEALENTRRLHQKTLKNLPAYFQYEYHPQEGSDTLLLSYGITARAAMEATLKLRAEGERVSLLVLKTLLPVSDKVYGILGNYKRVFVAEENLTGQYRQMLYGARSPSHVFGINKVGKMIRPKEIMEEIKNGSQ